MTWDEIIAANSGCCTNMYTGINKQTLISHWNSIQYIPAQEIRDSIQTYIRKEIATANAKSNDIYKERKEKEMAAIVWLPRVEKVDIYNDRVVKVTFTDGSFTKAECSKDDAEAGLFNLDIGITICIFKRILGRNGHKRYNDLIRDVHKVMDENEKQKEKEAEEAARRKTKRRKIKLKKAAKAAKERQEKIDIQKEAFVEAMRNYKIETGDDF